MFCSYFDGQGVFIISRCTVVEFGHSRSPPHRALEKLEHACGILAGSGRRLHYPNGAAWAMYRPRVPLDFKGSYVVPPGDGAGACACAVHTICTRIV